MKQISLLIVFAVCSCFADVPMSGTSFEAVEDLDHILGENFSLDRNRSLFGSQSLKWSGKTLQFLNLRPLSMEESGAEYGSHFPASPTFVMSIYNETPVNENLRIDFNGKKQFELNLNFTGWHTVWVPFFEMDGTGVLSGLDSVQLTAPESAGTLWLDDIVFCQYLDDRHPYPGLEVPFVKEGGAHVNDHWMPKVPHWKRLINLKNESASPEQIADAETVENRLRTVYERKVIRPAGAEFFRSKMDFSLPLKIRQQVSPICYLNPEYNDLREFGKWMLKLAQECLSTEDAKERNLFEEAARYYLDQGWSAGSSQGTAHHIGYSTRELQTSFFLMKDVLHENGLLDAVGDSVRWLLNFGEMLDPEHLESNLDYYNTQSLFRLMSCFLTAGSDRKVALLKTYSDHLSAALALTDSQGFRPDGTAWHHYGHYPAYATGAFDRVPVSLKALAGTSFRIKEEGHANFKRAFLAATIYSNPKYWGFGLAGRHPLGGNINSLKDACLALALCGTPDGTQTIDTDVASAYVWLWGDPPDNVFQGLEINAVSLEGHWTFPYAALSVHRRGDWSVNIKGFNKYVWASEIYHLDNRYGRYQSSGVVQILPSMTPEEAGYTEDGWDWNHPPGATVIERPFRELEPEKELVMFKSEEPYAGGCSLGGNGVWAMTLNEADGFTIDPVKEKMSFPGNLKARKSVFCFDDQILCLGSGITSDDPSAPVHTVLFQNGIENTNNAVQFKDGLLIDPIGNGYQILDGVEPVLTVAEQFSPNNKYSLRRGAGKKGASPNASGLFAKAWIDHGPAPKNASYAYVVFPGMTGKGGSGFSLQILRQDNVAHVAEVSNTTAYACFEAGELSEGLLQSVSVPCYVMIQNAESFKVAVANPDLNQEEDPVLGHFNGPSNPAPVTLRLKGLWSARSPLVHTENRDDSTFLTVLCKDGLTIVTELFPSGGE